MRVLIDTHVLIWYVDQDHLVPPPAYATIQDPTNEILVSAATIWEIAIKVGITKLSLSDAYLPWITKALNDLGAEVLPITPIYSDAQARLPQLHNDPFDRMMIAQALVDNVPIITGDAKFAPYGPRIIW